jgi:L-iditol 2-dehydrogenase
VGSPGTIEDAIRLARPGGEVALVGMPPARTCLDLTALWYKDVGLAGSYAYGEEEYGGEKIKSFQLALRLAPEIELETMIGPRFRLRDYREAIATARAAGRNGHVRVVFDLRS